MVIDKWTRTSNSNSLSIPLLGHKSKETFAELKKNYESLKSLNHKFQKHSSYSMNKDPQVQPNNSVQIDTSQIKGYIDRLNSILISINELIIENNYFELDNYDISESKDINSLMEKILSEYNSFLIIIKELETNKKMNYLSDLGINSPFYESQIIINKIAKNIKKDKNEDCTTSINVQEPAIINFNTSIDRGHINLLTFRREYHNSLEIFKSNFHYSIEDEGLSYGIRFSLFFIIVFFVLFVCYICRP
jgi:hypothetical protein